MIYGHYGPTEAHNYKAKSNILYTYTYYYCIMNHDIVFKILDPISLLN